jgi:hypothetical protein
MSRSFLLSSLLQRARTADDAELGNFVALRTLVVLIQDGAAG